MEIRKIMPRGHALLVLILVVIGVGMRLLPHMPNFTPVGAISVFGGAVLGWHAAVLLPFIVMVSSDLVLGLYPGVYVTWIAFVLVGLFGILLRKRTIPTQAVAGALGSGVIFFVVSNFGVWLTSGMYAISWQGLVRCYVMAVPFFRTSLQADVAYSLVLFGAYGLMLACGRWLSSRYLGWL